MKINSAVKSGLALGAALGGVVGSIASMYVLMPNFTSAPYDSQQRIEVYECVQNLPKDENMKWIQIDRIIDPFDSDSLLLILVLNSDEADNEELLSRYAQLIETRKNFTNIQIDRDNKVIKYSYKNIIGSVRVEKRNGCTVIYRIGE